MFGFHWYGLIIGIGILAAIQASTWLAKRRKIDEEVLWKAAWWALIGGLIGARAYHVLDLWTEIYSFDPISALYIWNGGLGIIGGILGGIIGLFIYYKFIIHHPSSIIHFHSLLDIVFFGLPLGQAVGRLGNWVNQEVYGLPTSLPWGIYINPENRLAGYEQFSRFHPLFAYEALWMVLEFGLMLLAEKTDKLKLIKRSYTGFYLMWYGVGRFWLDFLRPTEFVWQLNLPTGFVLNMAQAISGLMMILGGLLMIKFNPFVE
ncbi:prolipoprotein diacylglyceryl transferase [Candidatus Collierbacteria bacterium]|nr:prolipoprotein diacylglyceryl transferase [Candidatus Collierbacteria bacterium]